MAKVLISPIGASIGAVKKPNNSKEDSAAKNSDNSGRNYNPTKYKFIGNESIFETSFIVKALADYLKVDKIIFVGTPKSMWEQIYKYFTKVSNCEFDNDYWDKVRDWAENSTFNSTRIDEAILKKTMHSVDEYLKTINPSASGGSFSLILKYGLDEQELWQNFDLFMRLTEILEDGDELYLDITHSFRSIPLFMYLMMDFIQILNHKKITLQGLYYGMYEAKNELGYTPIVDLNPLFKISQWIRGVYDFINYGNGYLISDLIYKENIDKNNQNKISKKIKNISELLNINYLTDLQTQVKSLNKLMNVERKHKGKGPIPYIFPLIEDFIFRFSKIQKASEFQLELSKWYFENKRYGHGYICLVEAILTKLCEVYDLDLTDIDNRWIVKKLVTKRYYQNKVENLKRLAGKYNAVNNIRKRIAHAAFYHNQHYSFTADINQAAKNYEDIKKLLGSNSINKLNTIIPIQELYNSGR